MFRPMGYARFVHCQGGNLPYKKEKGTEAMAKFGGRIAATLFCQG